MNGFINKLKAVFFGPGWFPGTPRTGNYEDLPEVSTFLIHRIFTIKYLSHFLFENTFMSKEN
jgi:hypothetical protein